MRSHFFWSPLRSRGRTVTLVLILILRTSFSLFLYESMQTTGKEFLRADLPITTINSRCDNLLLELAPVRQFRCSLWEVVLERSSYRPC